MYQEDFLMRQIEAIGRALAYLLFRRKGAWEFENASEEDAFSGELHRKLLYLLQKGKVNEAENVLFFLLRPQKPTDLKVAVDFYMRLNDLDDETLEDCGFSREEVAQGLRDVLRLYQVNLPAELLL